MGNEFTGMRKWHSFKDKVQKWEWRDLGPEVRGTIPDAGAGVSPKLLKLCP